MTFTDAAAQSKTLRRAWADLVWARVVDDADASR